MSFITSRASFIDFAASIFGRSSSWTPCQFTPVDGRSQCLSRTVCQTFSKESRLSCRSPVDSVWAAHVMASRNMARRDMHRGYRFFARCSYARFTPVQCMYREGVHELDV